MKSAEIEPPKLREPSFVPISEEEARRIRGGRWAAGTCAAIG